MTETTRPPGQDADRPLHPLPDRVTMPLLTLVTRDAVDQDYVHAARRRAARDRDQVGAAGEGSAPRRTGLRGVAVVTGLFGLLIALAAVQTSRDADVQEQSRAALVERIDLRAADVAGLEERVRALRVVDDELRTRSGQLRVALSEATVLLQRTQITTGFVAVRGPGVRTTVDDNPDGSADGRVRATDLRLLVNGLWDAGAEAIAVNGRRLTSLSAIINSNIAVSVNGSPLTPPYVVSAIGDPRTLSADLLTTRSGVEFQSLADQFGFVVDRQNEDELVLPSAPEAQLRLSHAERAPGTPQDFEEMP